MTATGPENQTGNGGNELKELQRQVAQLTAQQLAAEVRNAKEKAEDVKKEVDKSVINTGKGPDTLTGDKADKASLKGKASDVQESVKKILVAAQSTEKKIPTPTGKSAEVTALSRSIIDSLSRQVNPTQVTEQSAPYLHSVINKAINGGLTDIDDMRLELDNIKYLSVVDKTLFQNIQNSLKEAAKANLNMPEAEINAKLGIADEERKRTGNGSRELSDQEWDHTYASYFNPGDREFVSSLYSPKAFIEYTDKRKADVAGRINKPADSKEVAVEVSKEFERKIVELFGKLYTRLDQEKPSEFFHEIEQQDIMRGILPVKNELKRRMTLLATELDRAIEEGSIKDPELFKSVEVKAEVVDMEFKAGKDEKRIKPRYRLNPFTKPEETEAGHFIHYLDQIVDHYIEARKYTHNARAIFLHPVDPEKGFYSQLAQFANDMSTVDFDQMMALPDNEIFRDAFSMYDKMVEETFASNDWRHFPTMFELKQNSLHTQVEEDVLDKLKMMYKDRPDITDARLEAALSMAVGASRGMFLNEIEKAAYADPHLTEDGKATFASYYNQDASALVTFNPMHQHFRWQAPNTMDPILFMPVEGFDGSQAFTDHRTLWKKMQEYKDSWLEGRGGKDKLGEKKLWADFLVNIGKVGGPLQRKGWRTGYMLEPLYVRDETVTNTLAYDYVKTWKRFENIGYDVMTDLVGKLPFLGQYEGKHGGDKKALAQKNELFRYVFEKYFEQDPGGLDSYMKSLRKQAESGVIDSIRQGKSAPRDIKEAVEIEASNQFLYRALARMVAQRIPSKMLRFDRDRLSENGVSKWRQIAKDMSLSTSQFDDLMKDLLMAEQLLRKEVSTGMRNMLGEGKEAWHHGEIEYKLNEAKIQDLLGSRLDQARVDKVKELYRNIRTTIFEKSDYLDKGLAPMLRKGVNDYRFTFAIDEADLSFIPWRGAGARVLPRAIGDISAIEKNVAAEVVKLPKVLQQMAIDGKQDYTPVIEIMTKVYGALDGIIGTPYAHEVVHHIAAMTINYFKKDTRARVAYGLFGIGRKNSLAAERAGSSYRVWEWDSAEIQRFIYSIESRALLPREPYSVTNSKPEYQPVYVNLPFVKRPVKLPESMKIFGKEIKLFKERKPDFELYSKQLRMRFGGTMKDVAFDWVNRYLPLVVAWLLFKYMKDALDESEGKKKK